MINSNIKEIAVQDAAIAKRVDCFPKITANTEIERSMQFKNGTI